MKTYGERNMISKLLFKLRFLFKTGYIPVNMSQGLAKNLKRAGLTRG